MAGPPVLAVRPFMGERRHLWCGEMSLPGYYERSGRRPEAARRHSLPTDLVAAAAAASRGDSSDSVVVGGRAAAAEAAAVPPAAATAAVFVPQPPPPRWTSFRGNSWQQELDAVRYLLDIDDGRLESAGTAAGSRRPGSVVSCRTECVSPDGPLKALPRYGFSPTIHDREVKTRAESDVNRANSLTAKTVKPLAGGAARRRREPPRREQQQQRWQQQQLVVPPQPSVVDRSQRSQPAAGHRHRAADAAAADGGGVGGRRTHVTEQSLEQLYRQMLSGDGGDRGGSDETLPYDDDDTAAAVTLTSMPAGASAAACQSSAADAPVPTTATIVINSSSVDDTYAHSAGAAEARAAFRLLRSHAGPRTAVEQALERDFALLVGREPDARRAPRTSVNAGAQARLLRPSNGAQTHGELFIRLSRDLNGGAIARQPSQQQQQRGQWPQTPHAGPPWQPRRAATYAGGFAAFGVLPEYGAAAAAARLSTVDGAESLRQSSVLLALGPTPTTIAFPSIVG